MHSRSVTAAIVGLLVTSAFAAPHPVPKASKIERRQEVSTYTCVMNAAATNGELVGAPIEPKKRSLADVTGKSQSKRQTGAAASPDEYPTAGGSVTPNTFQSNTGITVGIAGATQPLWSSTSFDVWDMANSQTISSSDTGLPMDIEYWNAGGIPTFSCGMSYNGISYNCDTSSDISIEFIGSSSVQMGQVQFPCEMTPPGSTADSPSYAPGWCTTHVVQYQKPDPATDPYTLDVTVYDADGTPIGSVTGAVTDTAVTGALPYTFDVGTGSIDEDPVTFAYGGDSWDSNDQTNHQCSVGGYDSGSRQIDCGFTC